MVERRLAAILAADVVGYSRLMGADEAGVLSALRALRAEVFDPAISRHNGRIVKLMGDGTLVEFGSVVDAVTCAVEVQAALKDRNAGLAQDERLELRIGINLGDVMVEGDDLYGDGVNVASRLEGLADPGGICVSEDVVRQASGKVGAGFEDLGEQHLKNIETPVRAFRVVEKGADTAVTSTSTRKRTRWPMAAAAVLAVAALTGAGWYALAPSDAPAINVDEVLTIKGPAIAALPFENLSGSAEQDLFARGMTEQVVAALTRFKGVRVLSRRASAKYADDLAALQRELGADYLLEGSIRRDAEKVRVTALLTDVEDGAQIWTGNFEADQTPANIVDVQDRLAGKIAGAIADNSRGAITLDKVADEKSRPSDDLSTFDCAMSANSWMDNHETREAYRCLLDAVERDPNYAVGWEKLSEVYVDAISVGHLLSDDEDLDLLSLVLEAARNAVEAAPDSAAAHHSLAQAYFFNGDHASFMSEATEVLRLNPNDAGSIGDLGMMMAFSGRWEEGVALTKKARAFNPTVINLFSQTNGPAKWHFVKGEYAEAAAEFQPGWDAYPQYWLNDLQKAYIYAAWGKQDAAEAAVAELLKKKPGYTIEDSVEFYTTYQFEQSFIDKMVKYLKQAGLPSRKDQS